jgi:DNA-directed RNA polymerase subunit M/transcription elongation factor TFIIS
MSATMNCPGCKTLLRIREEMAGKKIKCPRCAHIVAIPAKGTAAVVTLEEVVEPEERVTAKPESKTQAKPATTRPCPKCGERIPVEARKCRYCKAVIAEEEVEELDEAEDEEEDAPAKKHSKYKPCPRCGEVGAKRVVWTAWGSFYGPAMFTHVRCPECGCKYNGKSGRSNLIPAIIFVSLPLLFILAIFGVLIWYIHHLGYF